MLLSDWLVSSSVTIICRKVPSDELRPQLRLGWLRCTMDTMRTVCVTGVLVAVFGLLLFCHVHASDTQRHDSDEAVAHVRQKRMSFSLRGSTRLHKAPSQRTSGSATSVRRHSFESARSTRTQSSGSARSIRTQSSGTKLKRAKTIGKGFVRYAAPFVAAAGATSLGSAVGGIAHEEYVRSRKNRAPIFSVCPPDRVMTAPAREKTVKCNWDIPEVTDPDGEILRPVRTEGPPPGSDFEEGITDIEYTVSDSEGLTALCTFSVTVRVNKAPYFEYCPSDANVTAPANQTTAIYTWNVPTVRDPEGEKLSPVKQRGPASGDKFKEGVTTVMYTVKDSEGLSSSCSFQVTVNVKRCSEPPALSRADQYCDMDREYVFGSVCHHTCRSGYNLVGSANVTCQETDGNWSTDFPRCEATTCQPRSAPSHGFIDCTNDIQIGSECNLSCDRGYQVHGNATVLCLGDGTWSGDMAKCGGIGCQKPSLVANGHYDCPSGLQHPATCSLVCDKGFTASSPDDTTIKCQDSGRWSRQGACREQA